MSNLDNVIYFDSRTNRCIDLDRKGEYDIAVLRSRSRVARESIYFFS